MAALTGVPLTIVEVEEQFPASIRFVGRRAAHHLYRLRQPDGTGSGNPIGYTIGDVRVVVLRRAMHFSLAGAGIGNGINAHLAAARWLPGGTVAFYAGFLRVEVTLPPDVYAELAPGTLDGAPYLDAKLATGIDVPLELIISPSAPPAAQAPDAGAPPMFVGHKPSRSSGLVLNNNTGGSTIP